MNNDSCWNFNQSEMAFSTVYVCLRKTRSQPLHAFNDLLGGCEQSSFLFCNHKPLHFLFRDVVTRRSVGSWTSGVFLVGRAVCTSLLSFFFN